jgi:hypothetical protein
VVIELQREKSETGELERRVKKETPSSLECAKKVQ